MTSLEHVANVCRTYDFPYSPDKYDGDNPHFFVYCITDMVPQLAADNKNQCYVATIRLDYVQPLKEPYVGIMEDIKNKLLQEGLRRRRFIYRRQRNSGCFVMKPIL